MCSLRLLPQAQRSNPLLNCPPQPLTPAPHSLRRHPQLLSAGEVWAPPVARVGAEVEEEAEEVEAAVAAVAAVVAGPLLRTQIALRLVPSAHLLEAVRRLLLLRVHKGKCKHESLAASVVCSGGDTTLWCFWVEFFLLDAAFACVTCMIVVKQLWGIQ